MRLGTSRKIVSLKRWLQAAFAGFATGLLLAMAWIVWPATDDYLHAERNLRGIEAYGQLLAAANRLSAERGPSNVLMSIQPGSNEAATARLAEFRAATDTSLRTLAAMDRSWGEAEFFERMLRLIQATRDDLAVARREVDRIAALPAAQRSHESVRQAVDGMIAVVDRYQPVLNASAQTLGRAHPRLVGVTMIAQSVSDLREFGGRIASHIIPSISRHQKLTSEELDRYSRAAGQLWELERLLGTQPLFDEDETFRASAKAIRERFFGEGLGFLNRLVEEGRAGGEYSVAPSELTGIYVPTLKPLEELRDLYLSRMVQDFEAERGHARAHLLVTLVCSLLFLALAFRFLYSVRSKVLTPLLTAQEMIVSLANNQTIGSVESHVAISEMRTLFAAVSVLDEQTKERRRLMEHFRRQAETDRLTGLANRRRFEELAGHAVRTADAGRMGILYFDLDLFKNVNDTFGHQAGDEVLVEVARRLERLCDGRIVMARLGGDEFAALCQGFDENEQIALAESIVKLLARPFPIEGGIARIGSSVGIAVLRETGLDLDTLCRQADMALYEAKAQGRNRLRLFDDGLEAAFRERSATQLAEIGAASARGPAGVGASPAAPAPPPAPPAPRLDSAA